MKKSNVLWFCIPFLFQGGVSSAIADGVAIIHDLETKGGLPLTGNKEEDKVFLRKLARALDGQSDTEVLPTNLKKQFNDLKREVGLDLPDLKQVAMSLAATDPSVKSIGAGNNVVTPTNIITMPLGAQLWTAQSLFQRRSIFDSGVLRGRSLIPNLNGATEHGQSSKVSSRTDKASASEKFSEDFGVSSRYAGFGASLGQKHDEASEKTTMNGGASASVYTYATNTIRIEPEEGTGYVELRSALLGVDFSRPDIESYVKVQEVTLDLAESRDSTTFKRVFILRDFDGKSSAYLSSPKAHVQALMLLEEIFYELKLQYLQRTDSAKIQQLSLLDMLSLKRSINASIKYFYNNNGDSFVTEISGYSEVQGIGTLVQKSEANNSERNNSGTMTAGYASFIGGVEASLSIGKWMKDANAYGATEVKTTVYEKPNNGTDLGGYDKSLRDWLNQAINSTSSSAQLPPVAITPAMPTIPAVRPWTDDPFAPPKDLKEYKDWVQSRQDISSGKGGYKVPDWFKKKNGPVVPANADLARNSIAEDQAGANRVSGGEDLAGSIVLRVNEDGAVPENQNVQNEQLHSNLSGSAAPDVVSLTLTEENHAIAHADLYNKTQSEFKALRAYGRKMLLKEARDNKRRLNRSNQIRSSLNNMAEAIPNEITLDKMMVSSFKALPYSAVLAALRPNLELPVSVDSIKDGFLNMSALLATLNRYYALDTYINFIKSIPESNLANTSIPADFHRFVVHLESEFMARIQASMTSGEDIKQEELASTLNIEIFGLSSDKKTRNIKATKLFEYLGKKSAVYNYIYTLAEVPDYFKVIGSAPGGYLPLAPMKGGGYCLPRLSDVRQWKDYQSKDGYIPEYVNASSCIEITSNTDIPQLLAGAPQTPMFPLYSYGTENYPPLLNFVQFVGGSRLVIGRDVTMAPWQGDLTKIPNLPLAPVSDEAKLTMGYKPNMVGDPGRISALTQDTQYAYQIKDKRTENPYTFNSFLPVDMSWRYSLWFRDSELAGYEGYEQNIVLAVRFGYYPSKLVNKLYSPGKSEQTFWGRGYQCTGSSYCLMPTYHYMNPYSYTGPPKSGILDWPKAPEDNHLVGPNETRLYLGGLGNSEGTKVTGGVMLLYPITTDMLEKLAPGVFAYSSGSSPKDIFSMDDQGNSPFDSGFTRALLQK